MKFTAAILLLAAAVSAATVADVKADIAAIDTAVTTLQQSLQSNDLNYFSALAIDSQAKDLDSKIKKGTTDTTALTEKPSDADAQAIISTLTGTETKVSNISDRLIALKPKFDSLAVSGIAKGDINTLATDTNAFGKALVAASPAAEASAAQALADKFNADLARAAAAYN